jgi:hypothetical protein
VAASPSTVAPPAMEPGNKPDPFCRLHGRAADIVLGRPVSAESKQDVSLWTGCIAGGLLADEIEALVAGAGFTDVEVIAGRDVFAGAPQQSSAASFATRGASTRAHR